MQTLTKKEAYNIEEKNFRLTTLLESINGLAKILQEQVIELDILQYSKSAPNAYEVELKILSLITAIQSITKAGLN